VQPLLLWKSTEYCTTCVCIRSHRYPACNAHAPYCHLWPARVYGGWGESVTEHKMCVSSFSTTFAWDIFHSKKNERDIIKMYIVLHVKYPLFLSDFNETWIFSIDFRNSHISRKFFQWEPSCSMQTGERKWRSKLVAFRNFANAPKKSLHF
jgi:hypothetical protein